MNLFKMFFNKKNSIKRAVKAFRYAYDFFYENDIVSLERSDFFDFLHAKTTENIKDIKEFVKFLSSQDWIIDKQLFLNFFCFFFYEISRRFSYKKFNKHWHFNNPYLNSDKIKNDALKRNFYYIFLNEFKKQKNHNIFLRKFLKILN